MEWFKKKATTPIKTEEYLELKKDFERLRISLEALKLDVELYKKKLRMKSKLDEPEEDKSKDLYGGVLLPE